MYKVVSLADVHFGKKNDNWLTKELQAHFFPYLEEDKEEIGLISITGDLFDRVISLNEPSAKLVINFMEQLIAFSDDHKIPLRLLKGTLSHDYNQLRIFDSYQETYPFFRIIERMQVEDLDGFKILYLPEEYPTSYESYYKDLLLEAPDKTYDLILGHGMIDFVAFTGYENDSENRTHGTPTHKAEDLMRVTKGPILFGHIHDFHEYKDQIYYSGSFTRYSFADQEDKGFLVAEFPDKKNSSEYELVMITNESAPTYGIIDLDKVSAESLEEKLAYVEAMKEEYTFVKFKASQKADIDIIRKVAEKDSSIKVQATNRKVEAVKVDKRYEFILNKELPLAETIERFIALNQPETEDSVPVAIIRNLIAPTDTNPSDIRELATEPK